MPFDPQHEPCKGYNFVGESLAGLYSIWIVLNKAFEISSLFKKAINQYMCILEYWLLRKATFTVQDYQIGIPLYLE